MNIFVVSRDPVICAMALDDKRLNKMILETTQIICAVLNIQAGSQVAPHKTTHAGNALTLWAMKLKHRQWLYRLGIAYGEEIIHRHGRKHSCHLVLEGLTFKWPELMKYPGDLPAEVFHNGARHKGLGLDFTYLPVRKAYRTYLCARWPNDKRKPVWTNREKPSWYS